MKKIFCAVVALSVLAACADVKDSIPAEGKNSIEFGAYSARTTKAAIVDANALTASGFYVTAVLDGNEYFDETQVIYDSIANRYASTKKYFWPVTMTGHQMDFYAANVTGTAYASSAATFDYTVADASNNQFDVVVATKSETTIPNSAIANEGYKAGCSDLTFSHALTKINFSFNGANISSDLTYTVTSLKVTANSKGTYTYGTGWNTPNTAVDFVYELAPAGETCTTATTDLYSNLMLIPQTGDDDGNIACEIEYTVTYSHGGVDTVVGDFTGTNKKSFKIPTTVNTVAWAPNKSFRYVLTLPDSDLVPITFAAAVTAWDDEEVSGAITVE